MKAIALDLDGTLVQTGVLDISEDDRTAIGDACRAGVQVILATARTPSQARHFQRELGLSGPVIGNNGSLVELEDGRELLHRRIDPECATRIVSTLVAAELNPNVIQGNRIFHRQRPDRPVGREMVKVKFCEYEVEVVEDLLEVARDGATQIGCFTRSFNGTLEALIAEPVCTLRYYDAETLSGAIFVHADASKGDALAAVLRHLAIDRAETLAIGDSDSDLPIFAAAGHAVAVANATAAVRAAAHWTAPAQ